MRRLLATLAFVVACAAGAAGCGDGGGTPVSAVKAFTRAARAGDKAAVLRWLGPATRAELDDEAKAATDLAGGHRTVEPIELLKVGLGEPAYEPIGYDELERKGDHAVVEVKGPGGRRDRVKLTRVKGRWLVELK